MTPIKQNGFKRAIGFCIILLLSISFYSSAQYTLFSKEYTDYRWKADSLYKTGQFEKAVSFYKKAVKEKAARRFKRFCYYNTSMCFKNLGSKSESIKYFKKSVKLGYRFPSIAKLFSDSSLNYFKDSNEWNRISNRIKKNIQGYSKIDSNTRELLLKCYKTDQFYRTRKKSFKDSLLNLYSSKQADSLIYSLAVTNDNNNRVILKGILNKYGWAGLKVVGYDGDETAWLIVQHSDNEIDFQEKCLLLIENAIKKDNTQLSNYPYLVDRILINRGKEQIFGTQFEEKQIGNEKELVISPLKNSKIVNKIRNCFGLESVEEYLNYAKNRNKRN